MLRTVPLSISTGSLLYTQQWLMSYRFADSLRAGSGRNVLILNSVVNKLLLLIFIAVYLS